jgi:hypothetical protein
VCDGGEGAKSGHIPQEEVLETCSSILDTPKKGQERGVFRSQGNMSASLVGKMLNIEA